MIVALCARPCVMQCGRPACAMTVDGRDLCAHCFIEVVEIVSHEVGRAREAIAETLPRICAGCGGPDDHGEECRAYFASKRRQ